MLFTGLEDYKARGTQASQYFTASFYTEFAESKDLVLIRGYIVFTSKLTDEEAKWLSEITQSFYLNDVRYKLVSEADDIDRLMSCLFMALPFFVRGASGSKFLYCIIPVFDELIRSSEIGIDLISQVGLFFLFSFLLVDSGSYGSGSAKVACYIVPTSNLSLNGNRVCWEAAHGMTIFHNVCALQLQEERKLDLLKALAEILPYTTPQDSRQILPSIVQLLKVQVGCEPTSHISLGHRVLQWKGKFEMSSDLSSSVAFVEDLTRATVMKLTLGMAENNKAMAAAKSDEAKYSIKTQKQNTTTGLQTCNNLLAMTRVDRSENCLLGLACAMSINLSWKEAIKPSAPSTATPTGQVDSCYAAPAANGSNNLVTKKGRGAGGMQNQLVNRALDGISFGGRGGRRGRGRSWGWGWAGRGRGRGYQ
ncbi:hypothetical protein Gohar_023573 [Gossypium harknessii]|uniref:Uncharacterized protein n=1 Tax=Gossypium harknessii TaxID=34285 RepID=A0A7J9HFV5_9ROSI|nr:hypothetical protein [Gossypium harknessii]